MRITDYRRASVRDYYYILNLTRYPLYQPFIVKLKIKQGYMQTPKILSLIFLCSLFCDNKANQLCHSETQTCKGALKMYSQAPARLWDPFFMRPSLPLGITRASYSCPFLCAMPLLYIKSPPRPSFGCIPDVRFKRRLECTFHCFLFPVLKIQILLC